MSEEKRKTHNSAVLTGWRQLSVEKVKAGDHVHSETLGIPHSIVEQVEGKHLRLIGPVTEAEDISFTRYKRDLDDDSKMEVAIYSDKTGCVSAEAAVEYAFKVMNSPQSEHFKENVIEFAMFCKRGCEVAYEKVKMSQLEPADHVTYGVISTHAIVENVKSEQRIIEIIAFQDLRVKRLTVKKPKFLKRAVYNSSVESERVLAMATGEANQDKCHFWNKSDETFAKWCKTSVKELSAERKLMYPPAERTYNAELITGWQSTDVMSLSVGDHIKNKDIGIYDSIVTHINCSPGQVFVRMIGYHAEKKEEASRLDMRLQAEESLEASSIPGKYERIFFKKDKDTVQVAVYSSCLSKQKTVKRAETLGKFSFSSLSSSKFKKYSSDYRKNMADFAMECKTGWDTDFHQTTTRALRPGDGIKWKNKDGLSGLFECWKHGIVESVDGNIITCITYVFKMKHSSKIERIKVDSPKKLMKAQYISSFDRDTVLRLAQSRLGETEYRIHYNNDKALSVWCHTGRTGWRISHQTLLLDAQLLRPGHHVSWTRQKFGVITYDHHALVDKVNGQNSIDVYEFAPPKKEGSEEKPKAKGVKQHQKDKQIFDGNEPVYLVTTTPAIDPEILLEEFARKVGETEYNLITNNCENAAENDSCLPPQVRRVFLEVLDSLLKIGSKVTSTIASSSIKVTLARALAYAATEADDLLCAMLHACRISLHAAGAAIPLIIEGVSMWWDCKHDWRDYKTIRIVVGGVGTVLTTAVATAVALATPPGWGLLAVLLVFGIGACGTACTKLSMNLIKLHKDKRKCQEAFKGLY